jgi:O-antigen/teichoic acid export membrane protein
MAGAGLVVGYCISVLAGLYSLVRNLSLDSLQSAIKSKSLSRVAKRYVDFPRFSLFAALFSSLSSHSLTVMIPFVYGLEMGGFYFFIQRVLGIPTLIIGGAMGQSYFQRAVEEKNITGYAVEAFNFGSLILVLISVCFFIPIYFILPVAIEFFFGAEWIPAAAMGKILIPLVAMQFISAALSNTNNIFEKQKIALIWQFGMFAITFLSLGFSSYFGVDFMDFLSIYGTVGAAYYLLLFFILKAVAGGKL